MYLLNLLGTTSKKIYNRMGFYTREQCRDIAEDIGKELTDVLDRQGSISKKYLHEIIQKRTPHTKVKILVGDEELTKNMKEQGYSDEYIKFCTENYTAGYDPQLDVIHIKDTSYNNIDAFAHESFHMLSRHHVLQEKFYYKITRPVRKFFDLKIKEDRFDDLELTIQDFFGFKKLKEYPELFENQRDIPQSYNDFLGSNIYNGLSNEKRITAYIRNILRGFAHPGFPGSLHELRMFKRRLTEEYYAYTVGHKVNQYINKNENITRNGLRANIYRRTLDIVNKEINKAFLAKMKYIFWNPTFPNRGDIPTNSFNHQYFEP